MNRGTARFIGVRKNGDKFVAAYGAKYIGRFKTIEEAARARDGYARANTKIPKQTQYNFNGDE